MNSRIVQPAASFQPPETCTEHEECQAAQASHGELCDKALAHYEEVSAVAHHWNSLVPRAIEFYKLHGDRASVAAVEVKRFSHTYEDGIWCMDERPDGKWVRYSDYERLAAHVADLNHDLEAAIKECNERHG